MKSRKPSKISWKVMVSLTSTFLFFLLTIACGNTAKPKADTTPATVDTLKEAYVMPEYPGGVKALIDYLRIQYPVPKGTNSNGEPGRAIIRFVIDEQGRAIQPTVLRSVDKILDRRAIDKILKMPRWKPGELEDGTKVPVYMTVPVSYSEYYEDDVKQALLQDSLSQAEDTLEVAPKMPEYPGGREALMKYLDEEVNHSLINKVNGIQGRVIVQFVVGKDGSIINPRVTRRVDSFFEKEALRVIKKMPKWKPGELEDGTKVYVKITVLVWFRSK